MGRNYRPATVAPEGGKLLSELSVERLEFVCDTCARHGSYRRATLLAEFGDIAVVGLPLLVAERRKCVRAVFPPWPSATDARERRCGARFAEPVP